MSLFSVRSAGKIGDIISPIINPHNLHIDGFYCTAMRGQNEGIVVDIDVREITPRGVVINDHEDISDPSELVRLRSVLDISYELINKPVFQGKKKIGKVTDYAIETNGLYIQKLYVQPPLMRSMNNSQIIIGRSQIIEVNDQRVIVSSPEEGSTVNNVRQSLSSMPSLRSASTSETSL